MLLEILKKATNSALTDVTFHKHRLIFRNYRFAIMHVQANITFPTSANKFHQLAPGVMERGQVGVCVFQYSPSRPAILHRVKMAVTATSRTEATPASVSTATGGKTVKKVITGISPCKQHRRSFRLCDVLSYGTRTKC